MHNYIKGKFTQRKVRTSDMDHYLYIKLSLPDCLSSSREILNYEMS
jgi:hypothetical protein